MARMHRRELLALIGPLGLLLGAGCGVPDYRVSVTGIPEGTAQLQVAAYVQGALAADTPVFELTGPREHFTFGLNLSPDLSAGGTAQQAAISVAARRADGCLLAVGTQTELPPVGSGVDGQLELVVPAPAVTTEVCTATPPVVLAVVRRQQGPLSAIRYSLLLQGWGLSPASKVSIRSTALVQCATGSACNTACATACSGGTGMGTGMGGPGSGSCLTDCAIAVDDAEVVHTGPALIEVNLDPRKNVLQSATAPGSGGPIVQPIDLLQLLSQPLRITVQDPAGSAVPFTEPALVVQHT